MIKTPTLDSIQVELDKLKRGNTETIEEAAGLQYVVVRTYSAGVHAGFLKRLDEQTQTVELVQARRIYRWDGAFTLSALAKEGPLKPATSMFSVEVDSIILLEAIEVIPTTNRAQKKIREVPAHEA